MNKDLLYHIIDCSCSESSDFFQWSLNLGDVLTYILTITGLCVALWQFNKQMKETRAQSKINQRQTWFLNVIVVPQLDNIKAFYNELVSAVENHRKELKAKFANNTSAKKMQTLIAQEQNDCKERVSLFYDHFGALVSSYDGDIGKSISEIGYDLEDICTYLIENYTDDLKIREMIFENEQILLVKLNQGMKS